MADNPKDDRNPLLIPTTKVVENRLRGCPKCGCDEYNGRMLYGAVEFTCNKCKNKWHGGLPQVPEDPLVPKPPVDPKDRPVVDFHRNKHGEIVEDLRRVNLTQEFRKGALIPHGEDE